MTDVGTLGGQSSFFNRKEAIPQLKTSKERQ